MGQGGCTRAHHTELRDRSIVFSDVDLFRLVMSHADVLLAPSAHTLFAGDLTTFWNWGFCPDGNMKLTKDECSFYASQIGLPFSTEVDPNYPAGCYIWGGQQVYFNDVDMGQPWPEAEIVCKKATRSSTCTDFVQNGDEEGVDCGGSCLPCGQGTACLGCIFRAELGQAPWFWATGQVKAEGGKRSPGFVDL